MYNLFNILAMITITDIVWGGVFWTMFSDAGNRYAQAQRMNINNCWPVCEPLKPDEEAVYVIRKKESLRYGE